MFDLIFRDPFFDEYFTNGNPLSVSKKRNRDNRYDWPEFQKTLMPSYSYGERDQYFIDTVEIDGKKYRDIQLTAPGLNKDDFNIEVQNNKLIVGYSLEAKREYRYAARSLSRTYGLPTGVTHQDISARYQDGILHVFVPLPEEPEEEKPTTHKISIQ